MTNVKIRALMGASALVMAAGAAAGAHAQTTIYGGGSTLSAPYVRQAEDCYGQQAPLYTPGAAATNPPPEVYSYTVGGVPTTTNCSTTQYDPNVVMNLEASGSGAGVQAFFDHNPAALGTYTAVDGTTGHTFPTMHYGTSDTAMGSADVGIYNNGGAVEPATGKTVNVVAPGAIPASGQFANPATTYGSMVQIPLLITPITVTYSPVYKKTADASGNVTSYKFNVSATANKGVLRLDLPTYCKIFNGQITDWNDPAISALNGAPIKSGTKIVGYKTIGDPTDPDVVAGTWSLPIELVGRSDGSGTTSIFSRALAAQCSGLTGVTNNYPDAASTLPSAMISSTQPATPGSGLYTTKKGSGGIANYMAFTATPAASASVTTGKIAYLSPDYAGNGSTTIPSATYGLAVAALQNYANATSGGTTKSYALPTAKAALAAFGSILAPTGSAVADPSAWVQAPSKSAAIATPAGTTSYPIVGTTQLLAYTCYADQANKSDINTGYKLNRFVYFYLKNPIVTASTGILNTYGFAPLPAAFRTAEYNAFVLPNTGTSTASTTYISPKSDVIQTAGTKVTVLFKHNSACDAVQGG